MYLLASIFNVQKTEMVFEQFIQYDPIESWIKQPLEGLFSHIKVWLVGLINELLNGPHTLDVNIMEGVTWQIG